MNISLLLYLSLNYHKRIKHKEQYYNHLRKEPKCLKKKKEERIKSRVCIYFFMKKKTKLLASDCNNPN